MWRKAVVGSGKYGVLCHFCRFVFGGKESGADGGWGGIYDCFGLPPILPPHEPASPISRIERVRVVQECYITFSPASSILFRSPLSRRLDHVDDMVTDDMVGSVPFIVRDDDIRDIFHLWRYVCPA